MTLRSYAEKRLQLCLLDARADDAKHTYGNRAAPSEILLAGHVVEVEKAAVLCANHALCPQNHAVLALVAQLLKACLQLFLTELLCRFHAPAGEDLVGVVMVMPVASAIAFLIVFVMMLVVVMLMIVIVAAAIALLVVIVVMLVVVMLVIVIVAAAVALLIVLVMMLVVVMLVITTQC